MRCSAVISLYINIQLNYTSWEDGEPGDYSNDCGVSHVRGYWMAKPCHHQRPFVCEGDYEASKL